jgi:hypothetical protein
MKKIIVALFATFTLGLIVFTSCNQDPEPEDYRWLIEVYVFGDDEWNDPHIKCERPGTNCYRQICPPTGASTYIALMDSFNVHYYNGTTSSFFNGSYNWTSLFPGLTTSFIDSVQNGYYAPFYDSTNHIISFYTPANASLNPNSVLKYGVMLPVPCSP